MESPSPSELDKTLAVAQR